MRTSIAKITILTLAIMLCSGLCTQASDFNRLSLNVPGSVYIKPGGTVQLDMDVANLQQMVSACQAFLNFSSIYFSTDTADVSIAPGGGVWDELIWGVWNTGGDLDTAVGVKLDGPAGTMDDGTVAKITLKAKAGVEGATNVVFRSDAEPDPYLVGSTILSDIAGNPIWPNKVDSPVITIDGTCPVIDIISVDQNGVELIDGGTAFQGTVNIEVATSDPVSGGVSSGLAEHPSVTVTLGNGSVENAVFVDEDPTGVYNYAWEVLPGTPNGSTTITASVSDRSGNASSDSVGFDVNKNKISGTVEMDTLRMGGSASYFFDRVVVFKATNSYGALLKTWLVTVRFVNSPMIGSAFGCYVLIDVPGNINRLSAKTDWSLRRRKSAILDPDGQAEVGFAGAGKLPGGDLSTDNVVNVTDYNTLRTNWFSPVAAADINGDGIVNIADYNIMKSNWFLIGDPI